MMKRRIAIALYVAAVGFIRVPGLRGHPIVDQAMQVFPSQTERLEYWNIEELREIPDYDALRHRYTGPRLQALGQSMAKLGIELQDVDEIVLGWGASSGDLYGLAAGRFSDGEIADHAARMGLRPLAINEINVYCLTAKETDTCFAVLDDATAVFGSEKRVSYLLSSVLMGSSESPLSSQSGFAGLVNQMDPDAPVWGVAEGSAVFDWLRFSIPLATGTQIRWKDFLSSVKRLVYTINVDEMKDDARVSLVLECSSPPAAESLRGLLATLRVLGQVAWQSRNPTLPNPFITMELRSSGDRVELELEAPVAEM